MGQERKPDHEEAVTDFHEVAKKAADKGNTCEHRTSSDSDLVSCEEYPTMTDDSNKETEELTSSADIEKKGNQTSLSNKRKA